MPAPGLFGVAKPSPRFPALMTRQRLWTSVTIFLLLVVLCTQVLHAIRNESLTWDEGDHIFAGYETWKTSDYGLNPEHPPMVKMLATIPLLALPLKVPALQGRFFKSEAYLDGRELLFHNQPAYSAETLTFRVRLLPLLFTVVAALLVFAAGTEMFGVMTGLAALFLFCFEPTLLAHGAYVTTDMAASCTIFATIYAYWRWLRRPTWPRLLVVGVAAGVALGAKHSTVLLLPMLVLLMLGELVARWAEGRRQRFALQSATMLGSLAVVVLVGVTILWGFYGFRYAARPAPLALSPTLAEYVGPLAGVEAHGILLAARFHLLPESWLYGLADVRAMANGMPSYFFGRVYAHGVWFYFPVLFLIKSTLAMLVLLALTLFAVVRGWLRFSRELWCLIAPPALYLAVAMDSHLNIGARHILPIFVFCCVLAAAGALTLARRGKPWSIAVGVLLVLHAASSLRAAPNYIAYANEAWGGPTQTYRYLSDSNTDWAQQLLATSAYLREHNIHDCWIAYFAAPFLLPADYGIPCKRLPTYDSFSERDDLLDVPPEITGPVLISAGDLNGFEFGSSVLNPYESFRSVRPVDYIQDGIFVYHGTFAVPFASALTHAQRSRSLLSAHDTAGALREAQRAEQIAPGEVEIELALARALAASGDEARADAAFARALTKVQTMDPDAQEEWTKTIAQERKAVAR